MHPFVSGELACGKLSNRATILSDLHALPAAKRASNTEVIEVIEARPARLGADLELPFCGLSIKGTLR
jgi:hypothetical protein